MKKFKGLTALVLAALTMALLLQPVQVLAATPATRADAASISRWEQVNAGARAYDSTGNLIKNRFGFDGTHYYSFDNDGLARKGWYLESVLNTGISVFEKLEMSFLQGVICLLPTEDVRQQHVCYFDDSTGAMATGWLKKDGDWLYFDTMGRMQRYGWLLDGGNWYYFDGMPFWGIMTTGWVSDGFNWYYMKSSGAMATGWVKQGGKWYHLQANGKMTKNAWVKDRGEWYYMLNSGAMAADKWVSWGGSWYYLKADGRMMHSGTLAIGNKSYKFDTSGKWDNK